MFRMRCMRFALKILFFQTCISVYLPLCWSTTEESTLTTTRQYTLKPPVDPYEIGYNGTWEQFCNRTEINKDSPPYPEHEIRVLRLELCHRQELNKLTPWYMEIFAQYKYCVKARSVADELLNKLVVRFSEEDDGKRAQLFALGVPEWKSECARQCQEAVRVLCIDRDNPYFRMFFALISRACTLPWLSLPKMRRIIKEECEGHRIPGVVWEPLLESIHYKE